MKVDSPLAILSEAPTLVKILSMMPIVASDAGTKEPIWAIKAINAVWRKSADFPAMLGPRADPLTTPEVIKPEWFFYATFRWLKLFGPTFAVLSMGFIVFLMFVWPWVDKLLIKVTRSEEASTYIGIIAVFLIIGLTVWEAAVAH